MRSLNALAEEATTCRSCRLCETRNTVVFGDGAQRSAVLFVGEGPGREEDLSGRPFVGRSGRLLDELVRTELGLGRSEVYIANLVKCRPPENRNPRADEIEACAHFLRGQLTVVDPTVIVTLGSFAAKSVLGVSRGITELRGRAYSVEGRTVVPTFHPAAALRGGARVLDQMRADLSLTRLAVRGEVELCELPT